MYEYVEGKAMWANVSTPNTKFEPHKYGIVVLTDEDTATRLEKCRFVKGKNQRWSS